MKVTDSHKRDFSAYLRWRREWDQGFGTHWATKFEKGAGNTFKCFVELESHGKLSKNPKHPKVLEAVVLGKLLLNWQIKQWADGVADADSIPWTCCLAGIEELENELPWLPVWVWVAVENAARKKAEHTGTITYFRWKEEMKSL